MIKIVKIISSLMFFGLFIGLIAALYIYSVVAPKLPSIDNLEDTSFQVPLRIYDRNEELLAEYGVHRRIPVNFDEFPEKLINAFLAAEDDQFWNHAGVDPFALGAAVYALVTTGQKMRGGSTITMQVARNFYLTKEKTYTRKLSEILLALKIEREISKEKILELYFNKIFLGHRSYGVVAAAQIYYGKSLDELTIAQAAMIAGLPKAPSRYNPITNPQRSLIRRDHILNRMSYLKYISDEVYQDAINEPVSAKLHRAFVVADARYVTELVRSDLYKEFGDDIYKLGLNAYTTIDGDLQKKANQALRIALLDYDRRHGYRGIADHIDAALLETDPFEQGLVKKRNVGNLQQAVVKEILENGVSLYLPEGEEAIIDFAKGLAWAEPYINENKVGKKVKQAADVLAVGNVIWVEKRGEDWLLASIPGAEGALVSIAADSGAIHAMVGGFDFFNSKFNRVSQAKRQPGSTFKPFIYSSALEYGFTASTLVNDAPVVFDDELLEASWRPENYSGRVFGPTRLREALVKSRNLVSIRVLRAVGLKRAIRYAQKFGFNKKDMPYDLSLSLGSGSFSPLEIVRGYAVFANGGFLVTPHLLSRVTDGKGNTVKETKPLIVCEGCLKAKLQLSNDVDVVIANEGSQDESNVEETPIEEYAPRAISKQNAYIMRSIMREVVRRGTAVRAKVLGRTDFGGKTGTTNDQRDAWFTGFNDQVVTSAWVGFDDQKPLGKRETGGQAALPMWIDYMKFAFKDMPENTEEEPDNMVTVRIDELTGERVTAKTKSSRFEIFREGHEPDEIIEIINHSSTETILTIEELEEESENLF